VRRAARHRDRRLRVLALVAALLGCEPGGGGGGVTDAGLAAEERRATTTAARTLAIGAAAFVADSGYGRLTQYGSLATAGAAIAYAPIPLPAGTLLDSVTVYYLVGDAFVRPAVRSMAPATGAITAVWLGVTDADGAAIESQAAALGGAAIPAGEVVWVEMLFGGPSNRLYGARVDYREAP
jgi:hypothetical protein